MKYFLIFSIFYYLFHSILSVEEINTDYQIEEIERDGKKNFTARSNTFCMVSKNTLSGIYNYDIKIPVDSDLSENFTISYCKSDSFDSPIETEFKEYHSEWVRSLDSYIISISVPIENDEKYTFVKIEDKTNKIKDKLIEVELNGSYTWKIVLIFIATYLVVIASILLTCIFGQNFLAQCCNFKRK